ncbi:MAG: hypothetical protein ACREQA_15735 [Candidatus Binatia bacterium]
MLQRMSGYVLEPVVLPPPGIVMVWGYFTVATGPSTEPVLNIGVSVQPLPKSRGLGYVVQQQEDRYVRAGI